MDMGSNGANFTAFSHSNILTNQKKRTFSQLNFPHRIRCLIQAELVDSD